MSVTEEVVQQEEAPRWESFVREGQITVDYRFDLLPLGSLFVDYHEEVIDGNGSSFPSKALAYQRKQDKIAKKMVADGVRPDLFGVLVVNARSDGANAIVDGGTRFRALKQLGVPDHVLVPCIVFHWDADREIRNYVDLNKERSGLTQVDIFVAQVKFGDEEACAIQRVLIEETGHGIGYSSKSWQAVYAIKTAHRGSRLHSDLRIMRTLGWLDQTGGKTQWMLGAVDRLMKMPTFDPDHAQMRWADLTPTGLRNAAREQKDVAGQSRSIARIVAMVLAAKYNKGKRSPNRLDTAQLLPGTDDEDE